ncbi:DUF2631 domain-containing protein [Jatrophihabitans fulvus]
MASQTQGTSEGTGIQTGNEHGSELQRVEERPEMWGWHGEFPRATVIGGWATLIIMLLMMTSTHYNEQGTLFLGLTAIALFVGLLWERRRRKNAWRS